MRRLFALCCAAACLSAAVGAQTPWLDSYRPIASRILTQAQSSDFAWQRLADLTDTYGNRLAGSDTLEKAIDWAVAEMKKDGLENVHKEPVMVPKWIRGHESLDLVTPVRQPLVLLGLGNSVGTPVAGLEAEVVVVKSYDEMTAHANEIKGRIVLLNVPFTNYGDTRPFRTDGASHAAKLGAIAFLLRSVGPPGLRTPHTGAMTYAADAAKIPAAAVPTEDADRLQRLADRGLHPRVRLMMEAHFAPDSPSFNVVGEIVGRDLPKEVLVVGGHIDSWDVGTGATDDGGGCIVTWEALRIMKQLNLRPRRTVRVVLFTNEENGTRGGNGYRDAHKAELPNHVLLLESDGGIFDPAGFGFTFDPAKTGPPGVAERAGQTVAAIAGLLAPIGADHITGEGEGTDIEPASTAGNVPMLAHLDTGDYFLIHHTPADTIARITPAQVSKNAAAIAVMIYTLADLPWRLGHE
jgi:carboxypeptidase Q